MDTRKCHSCEAEDSRSNMYLDEGDLYYCESCVKYWEMENFADWFTGQPWSEKTLRARLKACNDKLDRLNAEEEIN
jgi:hypothetical protein